MRARKYSIIEQKVIEMDNDKREQIRQEILRILLEVQYPASSSQE